MNRQLREKTASHAGSHIFEHATILCLQDDGVDGATERSYGAETVSDSAAGGVF
jgi:hypothetical protein